MSVEPDSAKTSHNLISYCAKEKSTENRIYFDYPQFEETTINAEDLNMLITEFVESALQNACSGGFKGNLRDSTENWQWNNDEYSLQAMDIDYKIMRNDADYFSVLFCGMYNYKTAAHPINYFNSFIIDMKKNELVILSDLYHIDEDYVELVEKKYEEQIRVGLSERLGISLDQIPESVKELRPLHDEISLLEALQKADDETAYGFHSFLTDNALGISVPLDHVIGDHFEIMITYDQLELFKN